MTQEEFDSWTANSEKNFYAKILADSVAPNGCRLTTFELRYWRGVHSEALTHMCKMVTEYHNIVGGYQNV